MPNPFNIANFASVQTSDPELYARLAANAFFTSTTIQRHRLLRPFPHMSSSNNGLRLNDQPLGQIKSHSLELVVTRRLSNGFSANGALTVNRVTENRTVEEYETRSVCGSDLHIRSAQTAMLPCESRGRLSVARG